MGISMYDIFELDDKQGNKDVREFVQNVFDAVMDDAPYASWGEFKDAISSALSNELHSACGVGGEILQLYGVFDSAVDEMTPAFLNDMLHLVAHNINNGVLSVSDCYDMPRTFKEITAHGKRCISSYRECVMDNGQVFEVMSLRDGMREAQEMVDADAYSVETFGREAYGLDSDESLWVEYADGTHYSLGYGEEPGRFKRTGITCIIIENGYTTQVAGRYRVEESYGNDGVMYVVVPE